MFQSFELSGSPIKARRSKRAIPSSDSIRVRAKQQLQEKEAALEQAQAALDQAIGKQPSHRRAGQARSCDR